MAIITKQIFDTVPIAQRECTGIFHPSNNSCLKAVIELVLHAFVGSSKFFLVIYMLRSIINWKKIDKKFVKKQVRAYLRSVLYGGCYAGIFYSVCCLTWNCTNNFYYYSIGFGGMCGALAIFTESQEMRSLNTAIYTNLVAETIFRYLYWKNVVSRTAPKETFLFMVSSAIMMYFLKIRKTGNKITNLWFYYPSRMKSKYQHIKNTGLCTHETSCYKFFYEGFTTYFLIGYVLELLKYVMPRINTIIFSPPKMLQAVVSKNKFLFGFLLGSYVGIYRIVSCLLRRKDEKEESYHSVVAGFLAGSSYLFKPTLPLLAITVTTTLQLLIERIITKYDLQLILPAREIIFALSSGFLFHNRFLLPDSCPRYMKNVLNAATNGKADQQYQKVLQLLEGHLAKSALS